MTDATTFDEEEFQKLVSQRLEAYQLKEKELCQQKKLKKSDSGYQAACEHVACAETNITKNSADVSNFLKKQGRPGLKMLKKQILPHIPQPLPDLNQYLDSIEGDYVIRTVSDMHIGNALWWKEKGQQIEQLLAFVDDCIKSKVKLLVLVGDVIELWQTSWSYEQPKSFEEVAQMQDIKKMVVAFNMAKQNGVRIVFIHGNHDDLTTRENIEKVFGNSVEFHNDDVYLKNLSMIIAHGHKEEFFNSLLPIKGKEADPILRHPWGYYMARLYYDWTTASGVEETSSNPNMFEKSMFKMLDLGFDTPLVENVWEAFFSKRKNTEKFVDIVFAGTMDKANVTGEDFVVLHDGTKVTWNQVRESIKKCYVDFCHGPYNDQIHEMFDGALFNDYDENIFVRAQEQGIKITVYGHTHTAVLANYSKRFVSAYYVNDGSWGMPNGQGPYTFANIHVSADKKKVELAIYEMKDSKPVLLTNKIVSKPITVDLTATSFTFAPQGNGIVALGAMGMYVTLAPMGLASTISTALRWFV